MQVTLLLSTLFNPPNNQSPIKPATNQPLLLLTLTTIIVAHPPRPQTPNLTPHLVTASFSIAVPIPPIPPIPTPNTLRRTKRSNHLPRLHVQTPNHPIIPIHPHPSPIRPPDHHGCAIGRLRCEGISVDEDGGAFAVRCCERGAGLRGL